MLFVDQFNEEKDLFKSAFKNLQGFYIPIDYVYILMSLCFRLWAIASEINQKARIFV